MEDIAIPADLLQSSVAELAAEVVRLRAALDRTLEESAEATNGQARALVKIVDLKARAEAAEAKVARLIARERQVMAAWHLAYSEQDRDTETDVEADRQSAKWFAHWMKLDYPTAHEAEPHSGDCTKQPWSCLRCHAEEALRSVDAALCEIGGGNV